jgi:hypothetical protein
LSNSHPRTAAPSLAYCLGLAVLRGVAAADAPPWLTYDPRLDALVAPGYRLAELRDWADAHDVPEAGGVPDELDAPLLDPRDPRPYQREAVDRWRTAGSRGTVVLPTGAGKTLVALLAIDELRAGACVVTPTRALVAQWFTQLADAFGAERVGAYYGDEKEVRPLTITTYHSAFTLLERWGERFGLLVLDEAHHLADTSDGEERAWHDHLRIVPSPFRLGLTATYPDSRDDGLRRLVGPVVYRRTIWEMTDAELARFALVRQGSECEATLTRGVQWAIVFRYLFGYYGRRVTKCPQLPGSVPCRRPTPPSTPPNTLLSPSASRSSTSGTRTVGSSRAFTRSRRTP